MQGLEIGGQCGDFETSLPGTMHTDTHLRQGCKLRVESLRFIVRNIEAQRKQELLKRGGSLAKTLEDDPLVRGVLVHHDEPVGELENEKHTEDLTQEAYA